MNDYQIDLIIDAQGFYCPMPIVKTNKMIKQMKNGAIIKVLSTDQGSKRDFESWCKKTGNTLLEMSENDDVFTYIIQKGR
jgi:tRNA 2-thiouridine synthesizing protein A